MEDLILMDTQVTPFVNFDIQRGLMEIKGNSTPENSDAFYEPIWDYIDSLNENPPPELSIVFEFKYINSSSHKCLIGVLRKLKELKDKNKEMKLTINWMYEKNDEDIYDAGKESEELGGLQFNMVEI